VAHSWRAGPYRLTALCAASLAFAAPDAAAVALGDAEVRSALGEALDARIPVTIGPGESIEPSCFTLARDPAGDAPRLAAARISIERSARGIYLRIHSAASVAEPSLSFGIVAACPGQAGEYRRDYLLSIAAASAATGAAAPEATTTAAAPSGASGFAASRMGSIVATLVARIGDTLESIANAIFPRNRAAKKSYIAALRETNPPLASLGDSDPIPIDTPIALPDLRTFARSRPPADTQLAAAPPPRLPAQPAPVAARPKAAPVARERAAPRERLAMAKPAIESKAPSETLAPARTAPAPPRRQPSPGFVLKLSSGEVDLSRSRTIDDRMRAQLRDRLLVLDSDDQVAALLALRNSVRQLETRVAELQLKLAGMPSSFPAPKVEAAKPASPAASKPEAVVPAPAPAIAAAPAPRPAPTAPAPPPAAAPVAPPPAAAPVPPPPAVTSAPLPPPPPPPVAAPVPPAPVATKPEPAAPPKAATEPVSTPAPEPSAAPKPAPPKPAAAPSVGTSAADNEWVRYGLWGVAVVLIAVAALLAWGLARRRKASFEEEEEAPVEEAPVEEAPVEDEIVVAEEHVPIEPATRLPEGNTDDLRRRYIEQRFPEIVNRTIVLDDPGSVVKGARLFYEDGAVARAVELLHLAIEHNPGEVRTWLALFEIFRLERLAGEFAELARRFKELHGKSEHWHKVQYFGREIDPGNALYQEEAINKFETIGPSQARRMAAAASFDPVAENWLNAPMDFENEVLANDLRKALMAEKGINEEDLVANPMPALRNVEMFTVA
jgi:hypothetical protein